MRAGSLRDRISFQRLGDVVDIYGNVSQDWQDIEAAPGVPMKVWADVRETPGKERVDAGRVESAKTATIRIRSSIATRALTEADRVMARGDFWNIRGIAPVGNSRSMLDLLCESGVAT